MSELLTIASTFKVSEPVFKISLDRNDSDLYFEVKNRYLPTKNGDPLQELLASNWRESLYKEKRCFKGDVAIDSTYSKLFSTIKEVAINSSPLKNPKQSRLYKWLKEMNPRYNDNLSIGFIALYRYIINNDLKNKNNINTNPHAKNVIAILELMREKYEV